MNRWFLVAAIVGLGALLYSAYNKDKQSIHNPIASILPFKSEYNVRKITVLQGHEFDITLEDGRRVLARLSIKTPPQAKQKVVSFISHSRKPRCVVLDKNSDFWTVDLLVEDVRMSNSNQSVTEWLRQQNLAWDN